MVPELQSRTGSFRGWRSKTCIKHNKTGRSPKREVEGEGKDGRLGVNKKFQVDFTSEEITQKTLEDGGLPKEGLKDSVK